MRMSQATSGILFVCVAAVITAASGCGKNDVKESVAKPKSAVDKSSDQDAKTIATTGTAHEGWWCQEHGVPEHLCSLCSDEMAAKFKKEGDWCKLHDRAQSQCFKCDPDLYKKYEAMYVAKFNKKPPMPPREEFEN